MITNKSEINGIENIGYHVNEEDLTERNTDHAEKSPDDGKEKVGDDKTDKASKPDERPTWSNGLEFLMSCIAMSVGLGNIWRFPFTAFENGGGAFLIPYIIVLLLVGKPMYYLEMILGQFSGRNSVVVWEVNPAMRGVGVGQLIAAFCIATYYVSIMGLTLFYLIQSFSALLPWSVCQEEWGDDCFSASDKNNSGHNLNKTTSTELYFLKEVLNEFDDINSGIGIPNWRLTLCLLAAWIGVFCVMMRGVKSSGKASYFLALFPYVIMFTLLIRAVTLEGAVDGIIFFITPDWSQLYNPQVWYAAVTQVFFSLSVCIGAIIMYSSYNNFTHNVYRDAMIVTTIDTFTSLLAGFTIFSILGNLAHEKGVKDIRDVIGTGGASLAFISYPDAISKFEWVPQVFSVLFFLMLLVLGMGCAISYMCSISAVLSDHYKEYPYWWFALASCSVSFLAGLVYVTPGGQYILNLVDYFGGTFLILGMAIGELVGVIWIYGLEDFCEDIEFMTGRKVSVYWRWCWGVVTPLIMLFVFFYAFASIQPLTYGEKFYPISGYVAGWSLLAFGLLQLPIWMGVSFFKNRSGSISKTIAKSFSITPKWGPKDSKKNLEWRNFKDDARRHRESFKLTKFGHLLYSLNGTYRNEIKY